MTPIQKVIYKKDKKIKPIWLMRQAGRYLPEFRKIRKINTNFIDLCLNKKKVKEITLQPLLRFDLDAAIIFSDILMVPYGLDQDVNFKKNYGPVLGELKLQNLYKVSYRDFTNKLNPVYESLKKTKKDKLLKNKDLIGFVGGPWTILVYMLNKRSPKKKLNKLIKDKKLTSDLLEIITDFLCTHIKNQVKSGASVIQIFDSWAGLVKNKDLERNIYNPTKKVVKFIRSLKTPTICFPRNIDNYKEFIDETKPDVINIDYKVDPIKIVNNIKIPVQGGLDPKVLLTNRKNIKIKAQRYLDIFKNHPYIFNLGHGVLPQTNPDMVEYLINLVKNVK
jgi:uroporphyrinogen decarboxylase